MPPLTQPPASPPGPIIALAGNPNCGKSTLFNRLTGSRQHIGNFPGVTVEKKAGSLLARPGAVLVDLPGIYALSPHSAEEVVARDFLLRPEVGLILNVVDATSLPRSLYFTLQLLELGKPLLFVLNQIDALEGQTIGIARLSAALGVPVFPVSARTGEGMDALTAALQAELFPPPPEGPRCFSGPLAETLSQVSQLAAPALERTGLPPAFAAVGLLTGDPFVTRRLALPQPVREALAALAPPTPSVQIAAARYAYVEKLLARCVWGPATPAAARRTRRLDALFTHRVWGLPLFFALLGGVFFLTFRGIGGPLRTGLAQGLGALPKWLAPQIPLSPLLSRLLWDGLWAGVGTVLSFLPILLTLFFCLALLEDSGYLARIAFLCDRPLRRFGLSGRAVVPLLLGYGCSVPAILAARTLSSRRERALVIVVAPFLSCGAKLPLYALITAQFFPRQGGWVLAGVYCLGLVTALGSAALLSRLWPGPPPPFVLELPPYRLPRPTDLLRHTWERTRDFLRKAFSVILLATLLVCLLQSLTPAGRYTSQSSQSLLAALGSRLSPLFAPLGFGFWPFAAALLTGLLAKESIPATLAVLLPGPALTACLSPAAALSFLVFSVLYTPCTAALAATRRELGDWKPALAAVLYQTAVAYLFACLIYSIARCFP